MLRSQEKSIYDMQNESDRQAENGRHIAANKAIKKCSNSQVPMLSTTTSNTQQGYYPPAHDVKASLQELQ